MAIIDKIKKFGKSLYPTGRAFKMPLDGFFEKLNNSLSESEKRAYENALSTIDSAIPDNSNFTAEDATQWERRLGLIQGQGTLVQRKAAIKRKMNHPGLSKTRQSALFLQKQLQDADFDVNVIENINIGSLGLNLINPSNSINLAQWKSQTSSVDNNFTKVVYGNLIFVAIAGSGTGNRVMTSSDGITWTTRSTPADNNWRGLAFGNGLFVAVSDDGADQVMTSPDGINWTLRTAATTLDWLDVSYGNGRFVAIGNSGNPLSTNIVMTSTNGTTWTIQSAFAGKDVKSITFGSGYFVVFGVDFCMRSTNGVSTSWQEINVNNNTWVSVTFGKNLFVAVANDSTNRIAYSTDLGVTWDYKSIPNANYTSVCFGNNHFVIVSTDGNTLYSIDARIWNILAPVNGNDWQSVVSGNDLFVAVANSGTGNRVMTLNIKNENICVDKIKSELDQFFFIENLRMVFFIGELINNYTWDSGNANDGAWSSIIFGNGLFVAIGTALSGNKVMISRDGVTWSEYASASNISWQSITYGNGVFVAISSSGAGDRVMTSSNGTTWTLRVSSVSNIWRSITFGNGIFVAVSENGTNRVLRSTDNGVTWTSHSAASASSWRSVVYGNGIFVAVASSGEVMTSTDGITWTTRTPATTNSHLSITFGNGLFVVVDSSGTGNRVMTSPDGINWTARVSAADESWISVTYGNGLFVAVADNSFTDAVMTSPDGITWTLRNGSDFASWRSVTYGNGRFVAVGIGDGSSAEPYSMYCNFYTMGNKQIPIERKDEFRQLILKIKPKQLVANLYIDYV